jgi:superfamily II DNA/RNA helicase
MMFSATMSADTKTLIRKFVVSPLEVIVSSESALTLNRLLQYHVSVEESGKNRLLFSLLDALEFNQVMIFVSSAARANALTKLLRDASFPAEAVNGSMTQADRLRVYDRLKTGAARILVSTDLFARGVDFERINIAINYDMPSPHNMMDKSANKNTSSSTEKKKNGSSSDNKSETKKDTSSLAATTAAKSGDSISQSTDTYLHRVGRSGRFGTRGLAISFISCEADVKIIETVQLRFQVDVAPLPDSIDVSTYSKLLSFVIVI